MFIIPFILLQCTYALIFDIQRIWTNDNYSFPQSFFTISSQLGEPPQRLTLKISINTQFIWILSSFSKDSGFNSENSSSYFLMQLIDYFHISTSELQGVMSTDYFRMNEDTPLKDCPFVLIDHKVPQREHILKQLKYIDGIIGLSTSFDFRAWQYSLFESLERNRHITNRTFYFKYIKDKDNAQYQMIIDDKPEELLLDENHFQFFNFANSRLGSKVSYTIDLDGMFFGYDRTGELNHIKEFLKIDNKKALFSIECDGLEVDEAFYEKVKGKLFGEALSHCECDEVDNDEYKFIKCRDDFIRITELNIVLVDWTYKFYPDEFWLNGNDKDDYKKIFPIVWRKDIVSYQYNVGHFFLKKYITYFDLDKSRIGIYTKRTS